MGIGTYLDIIGGDRLGTIEEFWAKHPKSV